jgi:MOSC domain-containing protein YiiM
MFGENLTTSGVDVSGSIIGERWQIGSVVLEVCQPRLPCSKLGIRFGDLRMVKAFAAASRPGAYMRIVTEGDLGVGDEVMIVARPEHGVTLAMSADAMLKDPSLAQKVLTAPQLSDELRRELASEAA